MGAKRPVENGLRTVENSGEQRLVVEVVGRNSEYISNGLHHRRSQR